MEWGGWGRGSGGYRVGDKVKDGLGLNEQAHGRDGTGDGAGMGQLKF